MVSFWERGAPAATFADLTARHSDIAALMTKADALMYEQKQRRALSPDGGEISTDHERAAP